MSIGITYKVNRIILDIFILVTVFNVCYNKATIGKGGFIIMAPSEAQKKASAKWDKENMSTLGCKVKKEEAVAFKEYSQKRGKTSNTVLKEYVIQCIESDNGKAGD